ncbi:MAG: TIM barrel protein [Balneolaceae bacterium]
MKITRKEALKGIAGVSLTGALRLSTKEEKDHKKQSMQSFKHSVCRWPYSGKTLEELCEFANEIGIESIELLNPPEIETVQKYGLTCAMANQVPLNLTDGFNNPELHEQLQKEYFDLIPKISDLGITNIICFSGNRFEGLSEVQGIENCAMGLEPVVKKAAEYNIQIVMELLNSKVDHVGYQCDHTSWGVALCEKLGLDNFKLLYDIYHMQIMEGDVIRTIRDNIDYITHFHTGGVPGRNEIDDSQELNYKAITEAISGLGFDGFVAQEFIPKNEDVFASLKQGVEICTV